MQWQLQLLWVSFWLDNNKNFYIPDLTSTLQFFFWISLCTIFLKITCEYAHCTIFLISYWVLNTYFFHKYVEKVVINSKSKLSDHGVWLLPFKVISSVVDYVITTWGFVQYYLVNFEGLFKFWGKITYLDFSIKQQNCYLSKDKLLWQKCVAGR